MCTLYVSPLVQFIWVSLNAAHSGILTWTLLIQLRLLEKFLYETNLNQELKQQKLPMLNLTKGLRATLSYFQSQNFSENFNFFQPSAE